MPTIAIEINDAGMSATGDAGTVGAASPGYALLEGRSILTGETARGAARLKPRFVSHRHWARMDLESVGRPFPSGLRHADLVHSHLSQFWAGIEASINAPAASTAVLLAVPGSYSSDQLKLLLGIARSCGMPVAGLVDAALAAAGDTALPAQAIHLDVHLHRSVVSVLESDRRRTRTSVVEIEDAGLIRFQSAWVERLARRFVRETRFDPLHRGASEQALYDHLPEWTRRIAAERSAVVGLGAGDREHSIEVTEKDFIEAASRPIGAIADAASPLLSQGSTALLLSARAARLPGVAERLSALGGCEGHLLPSGAAAMGALRYQPAIESPGDELRLVLDLPLPVRHV